LVKEKSLCCRVKSEVAETRIDYQAQPQSTPVLNVMRLYQVFTSLFDLSLPHGAQVNPLLTGFKVPQGCWGLHAPCNSLGHLVSHSATPLKSSEAIPRSQVDSDGCKLFTIFRYNSPPSSTPPQTCHVTCPFRETFFFTSRLKYSKCIDGFCMRVRTE
jgi:hypothetical protein